MMPTLRQFRRKPSSPLMTSQSSSPLMASQPRKHRNPRTARRPSLLHSTFQLMSIVLSEVVRGYILIVTVWKVRIHTTQLINMPGIIFDVTLNQTDARNNNNKFYRIQLLANDQGNFFTWTRWGRVGEDGQSKLLGNGDFTLAMTEFNKKFKDKTGLQWVDREKPAKPGKYTFIERSYEDSSSEDDDDLPGSGKQRGKERSESSSGSAASIESKLPGPVQRLMKLIFNQQYFNDTMAALDYDADKMPLGKLSKRTLLQGYEVLKDLATLVADPGHNYESVVERSNRYFSLIPHSFGR